MIIRTHPLAHTHRDLLNRVIRAKDMVLWTNRKKGQSLQLCTVEASTDETVRIAKPDGRLTNVLPTNLVVITAQVEKNLLGNVGANLEAEDLRRNADW